MKPRRSIWFHLHFWVGWISAIPVILVCFTGGVLAFDKYLRQWEYPEQYNLTPAGEPMSIDEVMETYRSADPRLVVHHLGIPESLKQAFSAYVSILDEDGKAAGGGQAIVNPYTGELTRLGDKFTFSRLTIELHRHLAAGKVGQQIVGISSVVLAVTCIFGLILWWPLRGRTFVRAWKRGQALDWHNALGLVALAPLVVMAITGICFTWGKPIFSVLGRFQAVPVQQQPPVVDVPEGAEKLPLSVPLATIRRSFPEGQVTGVQPTGSPTTPYKWFVKDKGVDYTVFMNPYTGAEIARFDGRTEGWVSWYRKNFGMLHTMSYNRVLAITWGLLSAVGAVLAITGMWVSMKRWRRRWRKASA